MPRPAIQHLAKLFQQVIELAGFTANFMTARTVLLAKVEQPQHIGHGRPIAILSTLVRLFSKFAADRILAQWASHLPMHVSGVCRIEELAFWCVVRSAVDVDASIASQFIRIVCEIDKDCSRCYGPASACAMCLQKVGWRLDDEGNLHGPPGTTAIHIFHNLSS